MSKTSYLISFILVFANVAVGQDVYSDQFQTIQEVELVEVIMTENGEEEIGVATEKLAVEFEKQFLIDHNVKKYSNVLFKTREFIALGKEIYSIIEKGKPVTNLVSEPVQVLPVDKKGNVVQAALLENWSEPVAKKYRINVKNYMGLKPASFEFMLIFSFGGHLNGRGKYITGAQIKPTDVMVRWGYKLDASFKVQSVTNQGTTEDSIAGAVLQLDYKIWTVLQENTSSKHFFINGAGTTKSL